MMINAKAQNMPTPETGLLGTFPLLEAAQHTEELTFNTQDERFIE